MITLYSITQMSTIKCKFFYYFHFFLKFQNILVSYYRRYCCVTQIPFQDQTTYSPGCWEGKPLAVSLLWELPLARQSLQGPAVSNDGWHGLARARPPAPTRDTAEEPPLQVAEAFGETESEPNFSFCPLSASFSFHRC